jgi:hypothetical protein
MHPYSSFLAYGELGNAQIDRSAPLYASRSLDESDNSCPPLWTTMLGSMHAKTDDR